MLKVVIVEDEPLSRETLKSLLTDFCQDVEIVGTAGNVEEAVQLLNNISPDVVFLDIELQTGSGFNVLSQLTDRDFEVIFTTAFEQYAIKAIKFSSLDYLLKPIDIEELQEAVEKAKQTLESKNSFDENNRLSSLLKNLEEKSEVKKKICLSTSDGLEFIEVKDIKYCEANGSYTNFYIQPDLKIMVSKNLKEYENLLDNSQFMRVHNSFLINLNEVKKYVKSEGGYILMKDDKQIAISSGKKEEFLERMIRLN